jgi:hypothetical protein
MNLFNRKQVSVYQDPHKQECDMEVHNFKNSINAYIVEDDERNKCETYVDFSALAVICIERLSYEDNKFGYGEKTTITYKLENDIQELHLFISRQNHANLVKQYKEFIQNKGK